MKKIIFNGVHFTVIQLLQDISANADCLCDKAAVIGDKIKETLCVRYVGLVAQLV